MRWSEEVELLEEEMRRVLRFLQWHATWWKEQAHRRACEKEADSEGLQAYALRQADLRESLRERFILLWLPYLHAMPDTELSAISQTSVLKDILEKYPNDGARYIDTVDLCLDVPRML
jgi:hypothetical protein